MEQYHRRCSHGDILTTNRNGRRFSVLDRPMARPCSRSPRSKNCIEHKLKSCTIREQQVLQIRGEGVE